MGKVLNTLLNLGTDSDGGAPDLVAEEYQLGSGVVGGIEWLTNAEVVVNMRAIVSCHLPQQCYR